MGRRWELGRVRGLFAAPATWLGVAVVAACLANGIGSYLRRTGLIETAKYEAFWNVHAGPGGWKSSPFGLGRRCATLEPYVPGPDSMAAAVYVLEVRSGDVPGKLLKDAVLLALVVGSLLAWLRGKSGPAPLDVSWPSAALAALVAWKAVAGLVAGQPLMAAAGLRSFAFLGIALFGGWVTADVLRRLVPWFVGVLAVQLLLAPLELVRGIPVHGHGILFGEIFARRVAGTFSMPNTLGVFAACVVALATGYGESGRVRRLAWLLGTAVVLASGSATGLVLLVALALREVLRGLRGPGRVAVAAAGGVLLALVLAFLPVLLLRWDVHQSGLARVQALRATLRGPLASVAFGRGIGLGTTAASQVSASPANVQDTVDGGESTASALIVQTGVAGLTLFALALVLAALRNPAARPLILAFALASLTHNLTEAFPANLLLGLLLAESAVSRMGSGLRSTLYST